MPQRHRSWYCGAACVAPPSSRRRGSAERAVGHQHGDRPGAAGQRGQRVLEQSPCSALLQHALDHDVVDLAGRLAGDDQAGPDLAQLDAVGDLDDAVEHAQAGVAEVVRPRRGRRPAPRPPGRPSPARTAPGRRRRRSALRGPRGRTLDRGQRLAGRQRSPPPTAGKPGSHQRRSTMPVSASSCPSGMRSAW